MEARRSFLRGVFEAVCVVALFVGGGLGFAEWLGAAESGGRYLPAVEELAPAPQVWLVDGYNVLAVGLLAGRAREDWWSSRFRDELLGRVAEFEERDAEIWVAFDGASPSGREDRGRVRSVFAPSADEWLLGRIRERGAERIALVTADRRLAARARHHGVAVVAPAEFLARCRALS